MKTIELTLPTAWANYLFYGDIEGLGPGEHGTIFTVLKAYGLRYIMPLTMNEVGFLNWHYATDFGVKSAECAEYIFPAE
jgi:hypothetical protein